MSKGRNGPRQPGGGRQQAGPRRRDKPKQFGKHRAGSPSPRGRGEGRGEGAYPASEPRRNRASPDRPRSAPAVDLSPQAGRGNSTVQTVAVSADENGMRVDRFFEARFPGLSFSHIQRIIRKGEVRVDLDYDEDSTAEVDLNIVADAEGKLIEVQGTAERGSFSRGQLDTMLDAGLGAIERLVTLQREALG